MLINGKRVKIGPGVYLVDADLKCAKLTGAVLCGADLRNADLRNADLRNADLRNADLTGADLRGAYGVIDCGTPYHWRVLAVRQPDGYRILAGCRWFTPAEARKHWRPDYIFIRDRMPPLLAYIAKVAKAEGWV